MLRTGPIEYRREAGGPGTIAIFHGGHMRAALPLGERVFRERGFSVLVPSRPGYGLTPLTTVRTPNDFADTVAVLCESLNIDELTAVVGVSAGGRSAIAMAARHPRLVRRLILQSSVSSLPWPDRRTRSAASMVFNPKVEAATWSAVRTLMRIAPEKGLSALLGSLSTRPGDQVLADLDETERTELVSLFSRMRSGHGFLNDVTTAADPDVASRVTQPTLVIASQSDGAVPIANASQLVTSIRDARLVVSGALSHFIWFGSAASPLDREIHAFLAE